MVAEERSSELFGPRVARVAVGIYGAESYFARLAPHHRGALPAREGASGKQIAARSLRARAG